MSNLRRANRTLTLLAGLLAAVGCNKGAPYSSHNSDTSAKAGGQAGGSSGSGRASGGTASTAGGGSSAAGTAGSGGGPGSGQAGGAGAGADSSSVSGTGGSGGFNSSKGGSAGAGADGGGSVAGGGNASSSRGGTAGTTTGGSPATEGGGGGGSSSSKGGSAGNPTGGNSAAGSSAGHSAGAGGGSGGAGGSSGGATGTSSSAASSGGSAAGATASGGAGGQAYGGSSGDGRDAGSDSSADASVDSLIIRDTNRPEVDSACPVNQTVCGLICVNTSTSFSNCGACGHACDSGQVCSDGTCTGTPDGCSNTLANNLTLQQIAVYQTVKIPIMSNGAEVAMASRNAGVVSGRMTVMRVFVSPGSSWTARELSARLTLVPSAGAPTVSTSKKIITSASTDADSQSTFQFSIPAESMDASLAYSLEIVECGNVLGPGGQARFPSSGTIDMGVRMTGGLKVKLIPLQYGSLVPDTSETSMAPYAAELKALYPISDVSFSVGDTLTVTAIDNWTGMLDQVRAKRSLDKPPADVYYYGLLKPAADLRTYCRSGCTTGIGYVVTSATGTLAGSTRVAVGIGFGDDASTETMAHELGHNHGRNHVNCSTAGTITGIDNNYPYSTDSTGVWGFDSRTQALLDPAHHVDLMSYCTPVWISDYNYSALLTRVAAVNGVANVLTLNAEIARWRILLLDQERGPRWGIPLAEPGPAEGEPERATVYDGTGQVLTSVQVYRTEISDISAAMYLVPEPQEDWYAIAVAGAVPLPFSAPMPKL